MKRIFTAIATLGCMAMMVHAASNEVTSVNVVGYNKADIPPAAVSGGFNLIGIQFDAFDNTLMGIFSTNQLRAGFSPTQGDRIYIFDPGKGAAGGYDQYALRALDMNYYDTSKWGQPAGITNPVIKAGTGMWLQAPGTAGTTTEVVIAGEVVDVPTQSVAIVNGFQIMSYPYSTEIPLNDTDLMNDGATVGFSPAQADRIYIWNGVDYDQYALSQAMGGWSKTTEWPVLTTDTIPMGAGFWYNAKSGFTWTEPIPYEDALK